jgi:hypothetical protein
MTAIVGITKDDKVWMGGDSAGVAGLSITVRKDPKVFKNGELIFGFTSSFRMGQLLQYSFTPPEHPKNIGIDRYMNTIFINAIRKCFKNGGYATVSETNESGGTFLVGYRGRLFNIADDFQVGIPARNYDAVGCGYDLCLGSLYTTEKLDMEPRERIRVALSAAEMFNGGVRRPFNILSKEK